MVIVLVALLVLIRAYEDSIFYDPFLNYFKGNYTNLPLPQMDRLLLFGNLFMRYFLNTVLSLGIIYILFRQLELIKFAGILYALFFVILAVGFFVVLSIDSEDKMMLFYIRRFLIQPLFLLLFVPAFYFQERSSQKNNVS